MTHKCRLSLRESSVFPFFCRAKDNNHWYRHKAILPIVLMLPVVLLLASVGLLVRNEYVASLQLQKEVAAIRDAKLPFDSLSLSQHFFNTTSQEQSTAWREVLSAISSIDQRAQEAAKIYKPNYSYEIELLPSPGVDGKVDWPAAAAFEEYSRDAQSVIKRIEALTHDPKPTWQPLNIVGEATWLPDSQASLSISRMLAAEFCYAIYIKDSNRALRALRLDAASMVVYDWQVFSATDSITCMRKVSLCERIRASLAHNIWTQEQLDAISTLVGPEPELASRWHRTLATDRAMCLASIGANSGEMLSTYASGGKLVTRPASYQLELLRQATRNMDAGTGGYQGLADRVRASKLKFQISSPKFLLYFLGEEEPYQWSGEFSFVESYAADCERCENSRRLTRNALATKQYQHQNKRWPATLAELSEATLPWSDRTTLIDDPFEYRIAPDSKSCFIGTNDLRNVAVSETEIR